VLTVDVWWRDGRSSQHRGHLAWTTNRPTPRIWARDAHHSGITDHVAVFSSASTHLTTPEALDALHGWSLMLSDTTDAGMRTTDHLCRSRELDMLVKSDDVAPQQEVRAHQPPVYDATSPCRK
jgi:hypothetical protein